MKLTDEQADQYVARADSQLEKRLRLLEIGLLRHTALMEQLTQGLEKLTDRLMGKGKRK